MKTVFDDIFINNLPTLDLHGETRDSSRVLIKDFILDNYSLKNKKVIVIHGIGTGAIKDETNNVLKQNKYVESYHINKYNPGCTLIYIKENKS